MDQDRSARHHDRGPHPIPASARTARMADRQIVRPVGDALVGEALFLIRVEPAGFLGAPEAEERQEEGGGDSHRAGLYSTTVPITTAARTCHRTDRRFREAPGPAASSPAARSLAA